MKQILIGKEAQDKLLEGAKLVYDCVSPTLGVKSHNVSIARQWGYPIIVHDGVTIAREVESDDPAVNQGVLHILEAAQRTVSDTGDGTTTATILSYYLIKRGFDMIRIDKINPIQLRDELDAAYKKCIPLLKSYAKKTNKHADIKRVATISSTSADIGQLVADSYDKVGLDGIVTADNGIGNEDYLEYTNGMQFDAGYAHPLFVTNPDKMISFIEDAVVIVTDRKMTLGDEIFPALATSLKAGHRNIVIFGDLEADALATVAKNKMDGKLNVVVIRPPSFGNMKADYLEDIALITGARVLSQETGADMKHFDMQWTGRVGSATVSASSTMLVNGMGDKRLLDKHIAKLKALREQADPMLQEKLDERIARLTTGACVIRVTAKTETAQREKLERVKDAIGAARAALEEGIVAGGGATFLRLVQDLKKTSKGDELLSYVLQTPTSHIMANAGVSEEDIKVTVQRMADAGEGKLGYEMKTGKIVDMMEAGVIDPVKVIRMSLENAVAVAGSIITTQVVIAVKPEPLQMTQ